jgi:hypothetical protein
MVGFLAMSDDDFLKQEEPEGSPVPVAVVDETPAAAEAPAQEAEPVVVAEEPVVAEEVVEEDEPKVEGEAEPTTSSTTPDVATDPKLDAPPKEGEAKPGVEAAVEPVGSEPAPNYEAFYKQVMAPFKANGKTIELKTPAEAVQLMQMGANYTRKMQELVPHRKALLMLENNGLLDEGKLSFLIDIEKRNPEAIKKLIKDSGMDPMEIDTSVEPAYREGNHRVTDEEAVFKTALDDLKSSQSGMETLKLINTEWDQASKEELWKNPRVMDVIREQRENGVYDRIATEIDRQRTLGRLPPEVSFLTAYQTVGDQMVKANAFEDLAVKNAPSPAPVVTAPPAVVATRIATPKPTVANGDKAGAAATSRTSSQKAKAAINPLAMSDDDFLKHMENRV